MPLHIFDQPIGKTVVKSVIPVFIWAWNERKFARVFAVKVVKSVCMVVRPVSHFCTTPFTRVLKLVSKVVFIC